MTIPYYNLRSTVSADINRALRRDLKYDKEHASDVVLAKYDLSQGKAEEDANDVYQKMLNIEGILNELQLNKNKVVEVDDAGNRKLKFNKTLAFEKNSELLIKLQLSLFRISLIFKQINPYFNHIPLDVIQKIRTLWGKLVGMMNQDLILGSDYDTYYSHTLQITGSSLETLTGIIQNIRDYTQEISQLIDTGIQNYNEISKNVQGGPARLIASTDTRGLTGSGVSLSGDSLPFMI